MWPSKVGRFPTGPTLGLLSAHPSSAPPGVPLRPLALVGPLLGLAPLA